MAAPTLIVDQETVWNTTTSPKNTANLTTQASDILCVVGGSENNATQLNTPTGNSLTYSLQQSILITDYATAYAWTTGNTGAATFAVNDTKVSGSGWWGINALQFRGSDGVGASSKANVSGAAPTLNITTTQDNSAIVVLVTDWNATDGTTRTWRSVNGSAATELSYFRDSATWTIYVGYHPDAGTAGSKTVGLSLPTNQKYSIIAVEIKGTAGGGVAPPELVIPTPSRSRWRRQWR